MNLQGLIYAAVERRGYTTVQDGKEMIAWDAATMLGRQFTKLFEEFGELAACFGPRMTGVNGKIVSKAMKWGGRARVDFRDHASWLVCQRFHAPFDITNLPDIKSELADMQVVLCVMAEVVRRLENSEFDLGEAALTKAKADAERGVSVA